MEVRRESASRADRSRSARRDARGDADSGRRRRVDCFAIAEQLTGRPYDGKTNGVGRRTHAAEDTSELPAAANAPAVCTISPQDSR